MHKIALRQARFIRPLISILLLVFMSQTFATANIDRDPLSVAHTEYAQTIMTDMSVPVKLAMADVRDCCAPLACEMASCEMASCALWLLPATTLLDTDRFAQPYLIYNEELQSESTMTLLRPPIRY